MALTTRAARALALVAALGLVTACSYLGSDKPPPARTGESLALAERPLSRLEIPGNSRPGGAVPSASIPVSGPWRYLGTSKGGLHKYATHAPIRPRGLFFFKPKPGMRLSDAAGTEIPYDEQGREGPVSWGLNRTELFVYRAERAEPADGELVLTYPRAVDRERALNFDFSEVAARGGDRQEFVWTTIQDDWDARFGMLLPAPGVAEWTLEVPPSAELHFASGLVEPEIRLGEGSDGARLLVEVEEGGKTTELASIGLAVRDFEDHRLDLSAFAGRTVTLRMRSDPLASPTYDYVFVADPAVATRLANPVRTVLVFIDTLRPDHMSLYGYERDTTAAIDHLKGEAAVFTRAHSVAPWTLPSARAVVTGRQPEEYEAAAKLPGILREHGWSSAFIAGNVYLSVNFDMHRDWGLHRTDGRYGRANRITKHALDWLEQNEGRNTLLLVHYMDPHLPYEEPRSYRYKYAGSTPDGLSETFHLRHVRRSPATKTEAGQQYVRDRYDNNVRFATDHVAKIVDELDDNDILVVFSDHGEEFWDHQGFEHGHTLYEELLHVPFVIKAPGVPAASIDTPVSLVDVAPTILGLLDIPTSGLELDGLDLGPLMRGEGALDRRTLGFGRPLYGEDRWGVLHDGHEKWTTTGGREALYNLEDDPDERKNLLVADPDDQGRPYREALGASLDTEVPVSLRFVPTTSRSGRDTHGTWMMCTLPEGFDQAWRGGDPLTNAAATVVEHDDPATVAALLEQYQVAGHDLPDNLGSAVEVCWHRGEYGSREIYLTPSKPLTEVGRELRCSAYQGTAKDGKRITFGVWPKRSLELGEKRIPLAKVQLPQRTILMSFGLAPVPWADSKQIVGQDEELRAELEAIGYVDPDQPDDAGDDEAREASPPGRDDIRAHCPAPTVALPPPPTEDSSPE